MSEEDFEFEIDEDDLIDEYASEVNLILDVLGKIDSDLLNSVITNTTKFEDFDLTEEELDEVCNQIGFNIEHNNNIVDIAKKMRDNP